MSTPTPVPAETESKGADESPYLYYTIPLLGSEDKMKDSITLNSNGSHTFAVELGMEDIHYEVCRVEQLQLESGSQWHLILLDTRISCTTEAFDVAFDLEGKISMNQKQDQLRWKESSCSSSPSFTYGSAVAYIVKKGVYYKCRGDGLFSFYFTLVIAKEQVPLLNACKSFYLSNERTKEDGKEIYAQQVLSVKLPPKEGSTEPQVVTHKVYLNAQEGRVVIIDEGTTAHAFQWAINCVKRRRALLLDQTPPILSTFCLKFIERTLHELEH